MSKAPSNTTTTSKVELPPWLDQTLQGNVGAANFLTSGVVPGQTGGAGGAGGMAGTPIDIPGVGSINIPGMAGTGAGGQYATAGGGAYKPPSTFINDFNSNQYDAWNYMMGTEAPNFGDLGGYTYDRLANANTPTIAGADPIKARMLTDMNLQGYYNPFKEQVMNPVLADLSANEDRQMAQQRQLARASGTLRGSGFGIDNAILQGEQERARGATTGGLYNQMYGQATGLANADLGRELTAGLANQGVQQQTQMANQDAEFKTRYNQLMGAQGLGNINQQMYGNAMNKAGILENIGNMKQDLGQRQLQEPLDLLAWRNGIATGSSPYFAGSKSTGPSPYGSTGGAASGLGGAAAGAGIATALGLTGPLGWGAAGLGGLLGLLG